MRRKVEQGREGGRYKECVSNQATASHIVEEDKGATACQSSLSGSGKQNLFTGSLLLKFVKIPSPRRRALTLSPFRLYRLHLQAVAPDSGPASLT